MISPFYKQKNYYRNGYGEKICISILFLAFSNCNLYRLFLTWYFIDIIVNTIVDFLCKNGFLKLISHQRRIQRCEIR
jgi:hypothetical protein